MWFGPFGMILGLVLVIFLVVWLVRGMATNSGSTSNGRFLTPRQILDERYAKGEIDDEEYYRRRSALDR